MSSRERASRVTPSPTFSSPSNVDAVVRRHDHGDTGHDLGTLKKRTPKASPLFERTRAGCFAPPRHASILEALRAAARRAPASVALLAPGRKATSYDALVDQLEAISRYLRAGGIAPTGRVAVALPNGPEAAAAVLGTVAAAACAPLAPDLPEAEFAEPAHRTRRSCRRRAPGTRHLGADRSGVSRHSRDRARRRAPPPARSRSPDWLLVTCRRRRVKATATLRCCCSRRARRVHRSWSRSPSTTCSRRPRASSRHSELGPTDRCLNVMPLFHIHGLVAALLGSLVAGGSIVCTGGFRAPDVPGWIEEYRPTWYTAVPTIHQAMLRRRPHERRRGRRAADDLPVRAIVVGGAAGSGAPGPGGSVRRPGARGLRDDRGRAPDDEQSAARPGPQTWNRRAGRGSRGRGPRRQRTDAAAGRRRARSPSGVNR